MIQEVWIISDYYRSWLFYTYCIKLCEIVSKGECKNSQILEIKFFKWVKSLHRTFFYASVVYMKANLVHLVEASSKNKLDAIS